MPNDHDLLRAIYRRLDRAGLLRDCPELTTDDVANFFRKTDGLLKAATPTISNAPESSAAAPSAPPGRPGELILYCDGGSRGNPGLAGYGALLTDGDHVVGERFAAIGHATNNEAEYGGLIAGLEMALETGAERILVRSDSQLLVFQLTGRYKIKSPRLVPLVVRARELLGRFRSWRAEHIPRELNSRADALANKAMDGG